jgi:hypothetical protein
MPDRQGRIVRDAPARFSCSTSPARPCGRNELLRTPYIRSSQNVPQASFRLCAVALFGHHSRSAERGSGSWVTGCFGMHASIIRVPGGS